MKRAGVCLACSLHCHENHELVELYTKRNFRCDCGNPKFSSSCQFTPNKMDLNYENRYNQNFSGVYCTCQRPYPDPDNADEDEMIQCVVCEDWLHINHLNATVPANDQYDEMVCSDCMEDNDFLHDYSDMIINVVDKEIIVTDPDLDINESYFKKDSLVNGISKDDEKVPDKVDSAEPVNDKQSSEDKKEEISVDIDMPETKNGDNNEVSEKIEQKESEKPEGQDTNAELNKDAQTGTNPDTETKLSDSTAETTVDSEKQDDTSAKDSETATNSDVVESKSDENVPEPETKPDEMDEATKEKIEEDKLLNDEPEKPEESDKQETTVENKDDSEKTTEEITNDSSVITEPITNGHENKRKLSTEDAQDSPSKKAKMETQKCTRPRGVKHLYNGATFWPSDFRQRLCTCNECIAMYKDLAVLFLTDLEDTVTAYEALGKERIGGPSSQYEKGLQALSSLDRVHQINALTEYNKMKDKLLDFLKSFKDKKEIVKEEDIKAFFAGMKPKREPDGVYFCR